MAERSTPRRWEIIEAPVHDSTRCADCARLEADRLVAIQRYVNLRAARQCVLQECPIVLPVLDTALAAVETVLNEAWKKLEEHQSGRALAASA
jgi:hypothetical protein